MARRSLRKQLLLWLLLPLMGLLILDTSILYRVAVGLVQRGFDRGLYESAYDINQLIGKSGESNTVLKLPREARKLLLSDKFDELYYNIAAKGVVVSGDTKLPLELPPDSSETYFYDTEVEGKPVRVVSISSEATIRSNPQNIRIQVAETLNKRHQYVRDILAAIVVPQLLLVLLAAVIIWFGVGRGLLPLQELQSAVARRSPRDLSPVSLAKAPEEATALVDSINYLLNQLEKVLETQNRFIADAAHQLRTPLAGVLAQLELAQRECNPQELQLSLTQISSSMEQLARLVNQLLALARNQPEVAKAMIMTKVDLNDLALHATTEMVPAAVQKDIDMGFEGLVNPCYVDGDAPRLRELLSNLMDNAIRYTPRGGKVTVNLVLVGDRLILGVDDNGTGIPADEQEKVFERFHRVDTGNHLEGTGLGLAIVKEIALIHNAAVSLSAGPDGKGTSVQVSFPLAA